MAAVLLKKGSPTGRGLALKQKPAGVPAGLGILLTRGGIKVPPPLPPVPPDNSILSSFVAAGAYNDNGQLLRTLYAGKLKTRAQVLALASFDGLDDFGRPIAGVTRLKKQLPNKLAAKFAGIIGNRCPQALTNKIPFAQDDKGNNVVGSNVFFGFRFINCLNIGRTAKKAQFGGGYTEGPQSHGAFALDDIHTRINYQKIPGADRLTQGTCFLKQNDSLLFHLGYDGIDVINDGLSGTLNPAYYRDYKSQWFIYATSLATNERVTFSAGTNYAVMQGIRPQVSYNGYQFTGRCTGLAVSNKYVFVSQADTNEIVVLDAVTMAYVRTITTFVRPGALLVTREGTLRVAYQDPGTPNKTPVKLTGQPVGAPGYGNDFQFSIERAFDGNPNTYYASSANVSNGWLGLYVGPGVVVTGVNLFPSGGREADCMGWIQLSNCNNNDEARDRRTVYQIATKPVGGQFTRYNFANTRPWSYVRVFNPFKAFKAQEMEVWGYRLTDTEVNANFVINSDGTLTESGPRLSGHQEVTAMDDDALGNLWCREGGTKQGLVRYSKATGLATLTSSGAEGVKWHFTNPYGSLLHNQESPAALACAPDNSVWVGCGTERLVHLSPAGEYIEAIYYSSHSKGSLTDNNNASRFFGENKEYIVDKDKGFGTENGSWKLKFDWSQTYNTCIYGRLKEINTLSNGHTYAVVAHEEFPGQPSRHVIELVEGVGVRFTPTVLPYGTRLEDDGSLVRITYQTGQPARAYRRAPAGFDANHNPLWAAEVALPPGPTPEPGDPHYTNIRRFRDGTYVVHDGSRILAGGSEGYHVAGWTEGNQYFDWKTALSTPTNYTGDYPTDGGFDSGNGVQDPGGPLALLVDKTEKPKKWLVWCYMGENWKNLQCCYFQIIDAETGLLVLTFGSDAFANPASMTSVVTNMSFVRISEDVIRLTVNEEGGRGYPTWEISGVSTYEYVVTPLAA
jgi:hypothetical protein